jgi:hypothetical protein
VLGVVRSKSRFLTIAVFDVDSWFVVCTDGILVVVDLKVSRLVVVAGNEFSGTNEFSKFVVVSLVVDGRNLLVVIIDFSVVKVVGLVGIAGWELVRRRFGRVAFEREVPAVKDIVKVWDWGLKVVGMVGVEEGNVTKKERGDIVVVVVVVDVVWRVESGRRLVDAVFFLVVFVLGGGVVVVFSLRVKVGRTVVDVVFVTGRRFVVRIFEIVTSLLMKLLFSSTQFSNFRV